MHIKKILEKYNEPNPEALVESALDNIKILEDNDFFEACREKLGWSLDISKK